MKVLVCGGGPAGLTTALLLRRSAPAHEVVVLERAARDTSVGWGLTFPLKTFAGVDACLALPATEVKGPPRVLHDGEVVAAADHLRFETIGRSVLVDALRERCVELGVRLEYEIAVERADDPRLEPYDLVVVADGAASLLRGTLDLGTSVLPGESRFVWLATPHLFDHLSIMVQDTRDGGYLAWAYAYSAQLSTFIVECSEATWAAAGLARRSPDETCAHLAEVFRDVLAGAPLLHGGSMRWRQFPTVRNRRWYHGKLVLVGDAAHTAHYSTGSGTSEAIRDAVCLCAALERAALPEALASYQRIRQAEVERVQHSATAWMLASEQLLEVADAGGAPAVRTLLLRAAARA